MKPVPEELRSDHIPQTQIYPILDVLADLLETAACSLRVGGRLVYLLPWHVVPDNDPEGFATQRIPEHPMLEMVVLVDQPVTLKLIRKVIVMRRIEAVNGAAV